MYILFRIRKYKSVVLLKIPVNFLKTYNEKNNSQAFISDSSFNYFLTHLLPAKNPAYRRSMPRYSDKAHGEL